MTEQEKRPVKIYRLEGVDLLFQPGATEEQRLSFIPRYRKSEVDQEYHGRGNRSPKWFTNEFLERVHRGNR